MLGAFTAVVPPGGLNTMEFPLIPTLKTLPYSAPSARMTACRQTLVRLGPPGECSPSTGSSVWCQRRGNTSFSFPHSSAAVDHPLS